MLRPIRRSRTAVLRPNQDQATTPSLTPPPPPRPTNTLFGKATAARPLLSFRGIVLELHGEVKLALIRPRRSSRLDPGYTYPGIYLRTVRGRNGKAPRRKGVSRGR